MSALIGTAALLVSVQELPWSDNLGGLTWWMGPDETLQYVICERVDTEDYSTPVGNIGSVKFWSVSSSAEDNFKNLVNNVYAQSFSTAQEASDYLVTTGRYSNWYPDMGSIEFISTGDYIRTPYHSRLQFGTSPFCVEWWQKITAKSAAPRVFSMGRYSGASIAVSFDDQDPRNIVLWYNGNGSYITAEVGNLSDTWNHFAVCGNGSGTINIYKNGALITSQYISYNFTGEEDLIIGKENEDESGDTQFLGNITNFRWVNGTQTRSSNFFVPLRPLGDVTNAEILLLAMDSGNPFENTLGNFAFSPNGSPAWSALTPYGT